MSALEREISVRIGEVHIAKAPCVLKTTLGSCVGIAFVWRARALCGLAHCLLPAAPPGPFVRGAKYVDQAITSLLQMMKVTEDDHAAIEVHLAGGGNMRSRPLAKHVGLQNAEAATARIRALGMRVATADLGGQGARQLRMLCPSGEVSVTRIAAPPAPPRDGGDAVDDP